MMWQFLQVCLFILHISISSDRSIPRVQFYMYHHHLNHLDHHIYQHHDEQVHRPRRPLHHQHHPLLRPLQHLLGFCHSSAHNSFCLTLVEFIYPINSFVFFQCRHHRHQNHHYRCDSPGLLSKETSFRMVTSNLVIWQMPLKLPPWTNICNRLTGPLVL